MTNDDEDKNSDAAFSSSSPPKSGDEGMNRKASSNKIRQRKSHHHHHKPHLESSLPQALFPVTSPQRNVASNEKDKAMMDAVISQEEEQSSEQTKPQRSRDHDRHDDGTESRRTRDDGPHQKHHYRHRHGHHHHQHHRQHGKTTKKPKHKRHSNPPSLPPKQGKMGGYSHQELWSDRGGRVLEPALESGAVALLDSEWLCDYYYHQQERDKNQRGTATAAAAAAVPLPRRQDLPRKAFCSLHEIQQRTKRFHLGVILLSYPWLHRTHPDPRGYTLSLVVQALEQGLIQNQSLAKEVEDDDDDDSNDDDKDNWEDSRKYAIFWDFASLHQHPRTEEQTASFHQGLDSLALFYSHPQTICFQVTQLPPNYPEGYLEDSSNDDGADDTLVNCAQYYERGWPFVESCWISTKDLKLAWDISKHQKALLNEEAEAETTDWATVPTNARRMAPLTPDCVAQKLERLKFTNAQQDLPLVLELYRKEFTQHFAQQERLSYNKLEWGNEPVEFLSQVIGGGHCPELTSLELKENRLRVAACQALASCQLNHCNLLSIDLNGNETIGDQGLDILCTMILRHGSPLRFLGLDQCGISDTGCATLACDIVAFDAASLEKKIANDNETVMKGRKIHIGLDSNPNISRQGDEWLKKAMEQCSSPN
eukprot:CAMPEP_0168728294 /NCGR_PEP_ID=MMETSP0724-20121128/5610_1 /TAXON_ID=265536 /ORGANISM="Amphiprora sp., Strain CCMP467" /LENGTH=650 /DNA_ID=CAMNT_0008775135 /DNA_START=255 /DNA_END=2205 /DNA_ORIENTATION=+